MAMTKEIIIQVKVKGVQITLSTKMEIMAIS